jgi:glycosyltransferase involved in cell wall biosynthesis
VRDIMKVGVVSLYAPPHFGGAEGYVYRMVKSLDVRGIDACLITATQKREDRDNGEDDLIIRLGDKDVHMDSKKDCWEWFDLVLAHVRENDYTHILVNSPITHVNYPFSERLFIGLSSFQHLLIGVVHHDLGLRIRTRLEEEYKISKDWEVAAMIVEDEQREHMNNKSSLFQEVDSYWAFDSPLYFKPDFVIGNTHWSNRFIDPLNTISKFVLHPLIEKDETQIRLDKCPLENVNITMLNPLYHKGRKYMAALVNNYSQSSWTYRVLIGSYGGQKSEFFRMIENSFAVRDGRIDKRNYVEDIREVYAQTDIFIYPSLYEGYGMAAVEPMLQGVPVIVQDYPAIIEAVGEGAKIIPWGEDTRLWEEAVEEILEFDMDLWIKNARNRGDYLLLRQEEEITGLINLLEELL